MAGSVTVSVDGFGEALAQMAQEVVDHDRDQLMSDVRAAARATRQAARDGSPTLTGEYAAGWATSVRVDSDDHVRVVVHNRAKPGLTHLLEKGHEKFVHGHDTGERVPAYPHIEPAYEAGADVLRGVST